MGTTPTSYTGALTAATTALPDFFGNGDGFEATDIESEALTHEDWHSPEDPKG